MCILFEPEIMFQKDQGYVYGNHYSYHISLLTVIDCGWPGPLYNGYLIGETTTAASVIFFG